MQKRERLGRCRGWRGIEEEGRKNQSREKILRKTTTVSPQISFWQVGFYWFAVNCCLSGSKLHSHGVELVEIQWRNSLERGGLAFKPTRSPEIARDRENAFLHLGQKRQGERGMPGVLDERLHRECSCSSSCWNWQWSEVAQSCPTLHDPMDCSPLGSSVYGIFWARVLEWGSIAFSRKTDCAPSWKCAPQSSVCSQQGGAVGGAWMCMVCMGVQKGAGDGEKKELGPLPLLHLEQSIFY